MRLGATSDASAIIVSVIHAWHALLSIADSVNIINDDLHVVTLSKELLARPPIDLWPNVVRRLTAAADVEALLLTKLERAADSTVGVAHGAKCERPLVSVLSEE